MPTPIRILAADAMNSLLVEWPMAGCVLGGKVCVCERIAVWLDVLVAGGHLSDICCDVP